MKRIVLFLATNLAVVLVLSIVLSLLGIGRPGAGVCPVRGHSNVQGDRTMGIWERPPAHFLDALQKEFDFDPPRDHGIDAAYDAGDGIHLNDKGHRLLYEKTLAARIPETLDEAVTIALPAPRRMPGAPTGLLSTGLRVDVKETASPGL